MKKRTKIAALLLAVLTTAFGTTACGTGETENPPSNPTPTPTPTPSQPTAEEYIYQVANASTPPSEVDFSDYTTYYFDGASGNDAASGRSELAPKKSLAEMEQIALKASAERPIRILLKRGTSFSGKLVLDGYEATAEKPLVVDAYGDESEGKPKLVGIGLETDTAYSVVRVTESNTRLYNLEITDPYAYQGVYIKPNEAGSKENIVVSDCYVHDVNFFWNETLDETNPPDAETERDALKAICPHVNKKGGYGRLYYRYYGGIIFDNDTPKTIGPSWFENVYAINNCVERVARTGIYMATKWSNAPGVGYGYNLFVDDTAEHNDLSTGLGYYMHQNVNFVDNTLRVIGGDGIVLAGENSFLEGNVCYYANYLGRQCVETVGSDRATKYFNAAIWVFDSKNVVFQNNEAAYTFLRNGAGDGEGFDIDISCRDIYFQYNYAHHNEGGGLLLCNSTANLLRYDAAGNCVSPNGQFELLTGDWGNNYVRNNVFAHNGTTADISRSAFLTIVREVDDLYAYNNTVILGEIADEKKNNGQSIIAFEDSKPQKNHYYANNVFYSAKPMTKAAIMEVASVVDLKAENNLYFNIGDQAKSDLKDESAITTVDPTFTLPEAYDGMAAIASFVPTNASLFTLGKLINGSLQTDMLGGVAMKVKYVGAFSAAVQ